MNRERVKQATGRVAECRQRVKMEKAHALALIDRLRSAVENGRTPPRRLAYLAYTASIDISLLWTEVTWLAEWRRELAAARRGKRRPRGPGWPLPAKVMRADARRKALRARRGSSSLPA